MSAIDEEILNDFLKEAKSLMRESLDILEAIETSPAQAIKLADYANRVDRIMGAANNLALLGGSGHALHAVGDACMLCKAVGYSGAKTAAMPQLFTVTVAFLLDVTELVDEWLERLDESAADLRREMKSTYVDRLRWISDLYKKQPTGKDPRASEKLDQGGIDEIMKKLGMD